MTRARRRAVCRLVTALLVGVVQGQVPVHAHTADAPLTFDQVVTTAALVVRGRVTGTRPVRRPDRETSTAVTVAVDAVLKGDAAPFVSVVLPGGRDGRVRTVMVGVPALAVGDQAVLFLSRGPDGLWRPVGLAAGVYRVYATETGRTLVRAPVSRTMGLAGAVRRGDDALAPMALAAFEALVTAASGEAARWPQPARRSR